MGVEIHDVIVDVVDGVSLAALGVVFAEQAVNLNIGNQRIRQSSHALFRKCTLIPAQETEEFLHTRGARRKTEESFNTRRAESVSALQHFGNSESGLFAEWAAQLLLRDLLSSVLSAMIKWMHERHGLWLVTSL